MANNLAFRSDIQGLRAIISVMLFHYNHSFLPGGFVGVANRSLEEIAGRHSNIHYLQLMSKILFESFPYYDKLPLYFDSQHLNEFGSKELAKIIPIEMKVMLSNFKEKL